LGIRKELAHTHSLLKQLCLAITKKLIFHEGRQSIFAWKDVYGSHFNPAAVTVRFLITPRISVELFTIFQQKLSMLR
jgi:hypothetical protein